MLKWGKINLCQMRGLKFNVSKTKVKCFIFLKNINLITLDYAHSIIIAMLRYHTTYAHVLKN